MQRRSFLLGLGASLAAPAIVRAEIIMPVRKIIRPDTFMVFESSPCSEFTADFADYSQAAIRQMMSGAYTLLMPDGWKDWP